ncbi:MFS general substrate transporter [Setomelanomma holmii]|uniref:MFS general substrate transporter n=1 Tax=Setomelanomma holmii TaxID=210430 RepID=A0A9P4H1W4_9PLEO|nr:MFS general substrate transporter [Setomelanomma holmii]
MALVLGTCSPENVKRISSAFPSIELLDTLIQFFLTSPSLDAQSWFHLPTFSPAKLAPELLACIVSAGAASTPDTPLRKLGFALHEASRIGQAKAFEEDNSAIRDIQHLRNFLLQLQVGMWSGISRKMEIAESFLQPLMTMLRRGGRFRNSTWKEISPTAEGQGSLLEHRWHEWVYQESFLRMVYRAFELDRQSSMALLKPPLISYSEMQLPLPSSNMLWQAKTAQAWKMAYLSTVQENTKRPSALETFLDLEHLARHDSASTVYLHMIWGLIWEYRQMSTLSIKSSIKAINNLILSSRYQELTKQLDDFRVSSPSLSKGSEITLELMLVHLNAPLDDIQLFAGIEGQEEARSAYPALREWIKTPAARQSLWHAGQILRAAEGLPKALLCNFNAIAVYHAGLILWGYGFLKRSAASEHLEWTASQTSHDEIRLVPQPSADPADPLNLPFWRKLAMLAVMSIHPFVVNFTSSSISSALPIYAATPIFGLPPKTYPQLTYFIAVNSLMLGASNLWWVPLSNTFGRRSVNLVSLLLLTLSSMWAGLSTTYDSLLAARIIMGIGGGPADAVSPDVVGEIFFVHQRGRAMAIYTVFLAAGSLFGGLCGGYIVAAKGLAWIHWVNVILSAVTFVLVFFFQAETLYDRPHTTVQLSRDVDKPEIETKESIVVADQAAPSSYPPYTYMRSLKPITYRAGLVQNFMAPYKTLRLPGVWLVSLWYSGLVGLVVIMSTIGPQLLAAPPYLWGQKVGLINVGGIIGSVLGAFYTYLSADWTTKRLAQKDRHGFSEPESRLVTALPALFLATAGSLVFGFVAQNPSSKGWIGLQFGLGMVSFGLMQAPSVGFNYLIEAYSSVAGDCFVAVTSARAVVSFAWTFFVADWVHRDGAAEPFGIFGMLMGIFGLLTIPMLIWGKRLRIWTAKWVPDYTTAH